MARIDDPAQHKVAERAARQRHNTLRNGRPLQDVPAVARYLVNRLRRLPHPLPALTAHAALPYYENGELLGRYPTMLAPIHALNNELVAVHRTYLSATGEKAPVPSPRKLTPASRPGATKGAAIRLYAQAEVLVVAEGIETALALSARLQRPCWATVSARGLEHVQLPDSVHFVIIAADRDLSGVGQTAAIALRARLQNEGRTVRVMLPPTEGTDWCDHVI